MTPDAPTADSAATPAERRQRPIVELLLLAAPTIAQMLSYTVMQFTDSYMLARVGDVHATAAGMSGVLAFSLISLGVGVVLVVNTLVSQAFGRDDRPACGRYLWQGIWFGVLSGLVLLPFLPALGRVFAALGHEPALAAYEADYLRITLGAAAIKLAAMSVGQFLLAVNRPNLVLVAAVVGSVANFFGNYALIYGNWGFPAMGVAGAAWGTNFGVTVELLVLAAFAFGKPMAAAYGTRDWLFRPAMMRTLLTVGIPSGVQIVAEVLAWAIFSVWVIGQFGTATMAANNFMFNYMKVSFMPAFGVAAAVTALVGRYIGRGEPEVAMRRAHLGFAVTSAYMFACGVAFFAFRYPLIDVFTNDAEVLRLGATLMIFAAIYQLFDAMYVIYNGALRGAGDTFVPAVFTGTLCWGVMLVGGYVVGRLFPQLGVLGPWMAATAYGLILGLYLMARFARGGWRRIRLDAPRDSDRLPGFDVATQPG